ncbi:MAG: hypothetical protein ABR614_09700 [Mycobacteriales bacterium]
MLIGAEVRDAPFDAPEWRARLEQLAGSVRLEWQRYAEQAVLTAALAADVPGSTSDNRRDRLTWSSFVREVAVARRCSDQAAGKEIFLAVALVRSHPRTLSLLQAGLMPEWNAKVLVEECAGSNPGVAALAEAELAERACQLTPSRIRDAVRKIELRVDADAAAARSAKAATARNVRLHADRDDQATLVVSGPALPLVQFFDAVTAAARAVRAAGDPRGLDALRFDLAVGLPTRSEAAPDSAPGHGGEVGDATPPCTSDASAGVPAGSLADAGWQLDRRRVRPVQVLLHLPVTTALGLDNEPGWLPGYGWVSAPQCRQWLSLAELRQVCVGADGFVVDTADRVVRPEPTPAGIRHAVLAMVREPGQMTEKTWRVQDQHDPSPLLKGFVDIRDLYCDGPTGTRVPAGRCHHDHEQAYPHGPIAAWNLTARADRTHQLKHRGWTPLRTATSTLWFSPAGQIVEIPHHAGPPPDIDPDVELPDPDLLHMVDAELLREPGIDDEPPWDEPPF